MKSHHSISENKKKISLVALHFWNKKKYNFDELKAFCNTRPSYGSSPHYEPPSQTSKVERSRPQQYDLYQKAY